VRLFVMGVNEWRLEEDWPLPGTDYADFFLDGGGRANTAEGDGALVTDSPRHTAVDTYMYDPRNPVPTNGGGTFLPGLGIGVNSGPRDQRSVETRSDVLCFTTAPLEAALEVVGPVTAVLFVSSSAPDTDFTAKLVDVAPNGRAVNVADGILRARYRQSTSEAVLLEPGQVYEITVSLVATAMVFAAGHRVRLEVSSSNFPRFDRNTNTGGIIATEGDADLRQALNRVHHGPAMPSRLVLPVIHR
jgi:putative CocE/NonD family hydrolase